MSSTAVEQRLVEYQAFAYPTAMVCQLRQLAARLAALGQGIPPEVERQILVCMAVVECQLQERGL